MSLAKHDPQCPLVKLTVLKSGCPQCELIVKGRRAAIEGTLSVIRYEFPKPTLGIQKVIRILEQEAGA